MYIDQEKPKAAKRVSEVNSQAEAAQVALENARELEDFAAAMERMAARGGIEYADPRDRIGAPRRDRKPKGKKRR